MIPRASPPLCMLKKVFWGFPVGIIGPSFTMGSFFKKISFRFSMPFFLIWDICGKRLKMTSSNRKMHKVLF